MVHGYHVILTAYGFWLPNDPRGSWSDFVGKWELTRFGKTSRSFDRRDVLQLSESEIASRDAARRSLKFPAIQFSGMQARAIGRGFGDACRRSKYKIWACAILPEHAHLVIARHKLDVEQMVNLLKGGATRQLNSEGIHPLARFREDDKRAPKMWAKYCWKVFLDSETAIENAINYVVENPLKEGKQRQNWSFVTRFGGLPNGWMTYVD